MDLKKNPTTNSIFALNKDSLKTQQSNSNLIM